MTEVEPLPVLSPLHVAIWNSDVNAVKTLLASESCDIECLDTLRNTPLLLALKCHSSEQYHIVKLLLDNGANPHARDADGWSCVQQASLCDDDRLLAHIFVVAENRTYAGLNSRMGEVFRLLSDLPDFYLEISLRARSWVPLVSSILPSDTIKIYKRGSSIRCDYTVKELNGTTWVRGQMSHILFGAATATPGRVVLIDNERKEFSDPLISLRDPSPKDIDSGLHLLYSSQLSNSKLSAANISFNLTTKPSKAKQWKNAKVYKMQNLMLRVKLRPPVNRQWKKHGYAIEDQRLHKAENFIEKLTIHSPRNTSAKGMFSMLSGNANKKKVLLDSQKTMEMHLPVYLGDKIEWAFKTHSTHLCFTAEYHQSIPGVNATTASGPKISAVVARSEGVSYKWVKGDFLPKEEGVVILKWHNTKTDGSQIKFSHIVSHLRMLPPEKDHCNPSETTSVQLDVKQANLQEVNLEEVKLEDVTDDLHIDDHNDSDDDQGLEETAEEYHVDHEEGYHQLMRRGSVLGEEDAVEWKRSEKDLEVSTIAAAKAKQFDSCDRIPNPSILALNCKQFFGEISAITSNQPAVSAVALNEMSSIIRAPPTKLIRKGLRAKLTMSEEFPFSIKQFLPVVNFLSSTGDHLKNLQEFFDMKLPPGFPVEFELPIGLTVRLGYQFGTVRLETPSEDLFVVPEGFANTDEAAKRVK